MRTEAEIVQRIKRLERPGIEMWEDLDGRRRKRLLAHLPYSAAKPEVVESDWQPSSVEEMKRLCRRDLEFAWEKTLGHRGISASLMTEVMEDWVWLLCNNTDYQRMVEAPYGNYGAPKLALAAHLLDMNIQLEEYEQKCARRMAQGQSCYPNCDQGCGQG